MCSCWIDCTGFNCSRCTFECYCLLLQGASSNIRIPTPCKIADCVGLADCVRLADCDYFLREFGDTAVQHDMASTCPLGTIRTVTHIAARPLSNSACGVKGPKLCSLTLFLKRGTREPTMTRKKARETRVGWLASCASALWPERWNTVKTNVLDVLRMKLT